LNLQQAVSLLARPKLRRTGHAASQLVFVVESELQQRIIAFESELEADIAAVSLDGERTDR
jgi:hypothetical protein